MREYGIFIYVNFLRGEMCMLDTQLSFLDFGLLLVVCLLMYFFKKQLFKIEVSTCHKELNMNQITSFQKKYGGNHLSHLIYLQDKEVFWAMDQKVIISYKRIANKLIVLGDPIGEASNFLGAIKEFDEYSQKRGLKPIYYQVNPKYMANYQQMGYQFLKLGEEGLVNLSEFSTEGKQKAKLRTSLNKLSRSSYTFRVVHPPYTTNLMSEVKAISDSWLGDSKEKGFSVVSFSEEYVSRFPLAILCDGHGKIVAFATLANDYKNSISIDLMRKSTDSPNGTMDVLFVHIFCWAKEHNYQTCSLGMAPLANVGTNCSSFHVEKLLRLAYLHGNSLYKFKGLKAFKSKFASGWEPKYLAYKRTWLPIVLIQLILLINSKPRPTYLMVDKIKYLLKRAS
jgi:phosphatidylglycerol lysyltransferase